MPPFFLIPIFFWYVDFAHSITPSFLLSLFTLSLIQCGVDTYTQHLDMI